MDKRVWRVSDLVRICKRKAPKSAGDFFVFYVQVRSCKSASWSDRWPSDPDFSLKQAFNSVSALPSWFLKGGDNL